MRVISHKHFSSSGLQQVDIFLRTPIEHVENQPKTGFWGAMGGLPPSWPEDNAREYIPVDAPSALKSARRKPRWSGDMLREMTCMSSYPRSATVTAFRGLHRAGDAAQHPYIMQRSPSFASSRSARAKRHDRRPLARRSAAHCVMTRNAFAGSSTTFGRCSLLRFEPKQVIFRQGDAATDGLYYIVVGFREGARSLAPVAIGCSTTWAPGGCIGEIGLLSELREMRDLGLQGL